MRKQRPTPDPTFLFHPETDHTYVHFDGHEHAPFAPRATSMTRANAWWLAESALLSYWDPPEAIKRFQTAGLTAEFFQAGDTQAYVASNAQVVLVSFRGTQAGSLGDIVSDALVPLVKWTQRDRSSRLQGGVGSQLAGDRERARAAGSVPNCLVLGP